MTSYRYPHEHLILAVTLALVGVVIALTAVATVCGSALFIVAMLVYAYFSNRSHHNALVARARPVTPNSEPDLAALVRACGARLRAEPFETYVAPSASLNAYTFGLVRPQVVVLYAGLFRTMDADELRFIIGHELGHMALGHTWLNSLVGGMAGIPSPYVAAVVLYFAFRWWNRACEFSADRAGLLACGKPSKAASALIKLEGGANARSAQEWTEVMRGIEAGDDTLGDNLREMLSTHPATVRRLDALRTYAASPEYRRLQAQVDAARPLQGAG